MYNFLVSAMNSAEIKKNNLEISISDILQKKSFLYN